MQDKPTMSLDIKKRARDLGLVFDGKPGQNNAITDVSGVEVGFCTLKKDRQTLKVGKGPVLTGVTAVLPRGKEDLPRPVWGGHFNLNGNGEMTGTHWLNDAGYFTGPICITNSHSVGMTHHATVGWMIEQYKSIFQDDHAWAMPIIAETYDGLCNDICGRHITEDDVLRALSSSASGPVAEGNVGGGAGMQTYEFKGGTGTASRLININGNPYSVAALVQSNFGIRHELNILGVPVGKHLTDNALLSESGGHEQGSIIVIIATDAPMLPVQLKRLAKRGAIGIGRTGTSGGHYSGDIMLAFSVANDLEFPLMSGTQPTSYNMEFINDHYCDDIYSAAVQSVEEAVINAMIAAESVPTVKPAGYTLDAIDHDQLIALLKQYNRL
jgi:D-aminopeptidase